MMRTSAADRVSALERLALRLEMAAAARQSDQTELAMLARELDQMAKGLSPTDLTALQRDSLQRVGMLLLGVAARAQTRQVSAQAAWRRDGQVRTAYGAAR